MSTKSSLFLTNDNEHCYYECLNPHYDGENFVGYDIFLEIDKKNIKEINVDEDGILLNIPPGSEIYSLFQKMDVEHKPLETFPTKKELKNLLELARAEIKSCYSRLGISNSNVLEQINEVFYDKLG